MKHNGIITRSVGGLYTVESSDGVYECKARGIFRNRGISPCVGDKVKFDNGVIEILTSLSLLFQWLNRLRIFLFLTSLLR